MTDTNVVAGSVASAPPIVRATRYQGVAADPTRDHRIKSIQVINAFPMAADSRAADPSVRSTDTPLRGGIKRLNSPFPVSLAMLEAWGKAPYSIYPQGSGYRAMNCEHDLSIRFAESGIQVCVTAPDTANLWDLALTRWGYGEALEGVPKATLVAMDNEIAYHRAGLTEWYINTLFGLEQVLVLTAPPPNETSDEVLVLEFSYFEDGTRQIAADGQSIVWSRMDDAPALVYRHLYAKDATDRDLLIQIEVVEEIHTPIRYLRLRVDDKRAVYPITIARLIQQAAFMEKS